MSSFASSNGDGIMLLILSSGLQCDELNTIIENLRQSSKNSSNHKRRELYWEGYTAISSAVPNVDGKVNSFFKYSIIKGEGIVENIELTKRQKGLVGGGCDILGAKKHKMENEDGKSKGWASVWDEEDAANAWDDFMTAEPCIYLSGDGVYVTTKHKRIQCKSYSSSPLKSLKDIEKAISEISVTLRSVSFAGSEIPTILPYNLLLAGCNSSVVATLPHSLGTISSTSSSDVYEAFINRRSNHLLTEADKMIAQMQTDLAKNLVPIIYCASMKDASIARKNSLMKKVYVHESKIKFIEGVKVDGDVDIHIISGEADESRDFFKYGGIVFEIFYRTDLNVFG
jgi:hypothetical protein